MITRRAQRRTSLLALFVLLWGLVFPALAQAGVASANEAWIEVCTAQGIKKIQQGDAAHAGAQQHSATGHCILCCVGAALAAPEAPPLLGGIRLALQLPSLPELRIALPEQFVLLTAPPRAPPVLSRA
jgi:hypothetical protein